MHDPVEAFKDLPQERLDEVNRLSKTSSLSPEGVNITLITDEMYEEETINVKNCWCGHDFLNDVAERLEAEGDIPDVRKEIADQLRVMSFFVTQRLVPMHCTDFNIGFEGESADEIHRQRNATSLPGEGLYYLAELEEAFENGTAKKADFKSGQDILLQASQTLIDNGSDPAVRKELVSTIKLMSHYATQKFVPFFIDTDDSDDDDD